MRRRTQRPTEHERDLAEEEPFRSDERVLTRRATQFQEAKTLSLEEFRINSLQTSGQRILSLPPTMPTCSVRRGPARIHRANRQCLMEHMSQKRGGQPLVPESAAQLGQLDRPV